MSTGKKIGIGIGAVVVLVIAAMLILPLVINPENYRGQISSAAEKALGGRQVEIGKIKLSLWTGLGLKVDKFRVANREGFGDEPFIDVDGFEIKISILSLLSDTIRVKRIALLRPRIVVVRNEKGELSIADLIAPAPAEKEKKEEAKPAEAAPGKKVAVSSLRIEQGRLTFDDSKSPTGVYVSTQIDQLEVTVTDFSLTQPIKILVTAALQADKPNFKLEGKVGPLGEDYKLANATADLALLFTAFPLSFAQPYYAQYLPVEIASGTLDTDLKVKGEMQGKLGTEGKIAFREFAYIDKEHKQAPSPKFDGALEAKAWYDGKQGAFGIEPSSKLSVGPLVLALSGRGEDLAQSQKIEFKAASDKFDLAALFKLLPSLDQSFQESGYKFGGQGRVSLESSGDKSGRQVGLLVDLTDASVELPDLYGKGVGEPLSVSLAAKLLEKEYLIESLKLVLGALELSGQGKVGTGEEMPAEISIESNAVPSDNLGKNLKPLAGLKLGGTVKLSAAVQGPLKKTEQVEVKLNGLEYRSDHSDALLSGSIKNLSEPRINFGLTSQVLNLDKLFPAAPAAAPAKAAAPPSAKAKAPAKGGEESSLLKKMRVEGSVSLKKVIYSGFTVTNGNLKLAMANGVLESPGLAGNVAGGSFNMPLRADLAAKELAFTVKPSLNGVDINELLSAFTASLKDSIKGKLTGQVEVSGVGTEWEKMNKTLAGGGHLELQDGSIKGFDLFGGLVGDWAKSDTARKYTQQNVGKNEYAMLAETKFTRFSGDVKLKNGVAKVPEAVMAVSQGQVKAEGEFGFDYRADFHGQLLVNPDDSRKICQSAGIGPEFQAFLLQDGQMVWPFALKGTYPNLKVSLDTAAYGKVVGENLKKQSGKALKEGAKQLLQGKSFKDLFKP